jgi:HTH-type transcriptional regulator/antitoxin HigA
MSNGTAVTTISPRLAPAWRAVERATPVPLRTIRSKSAYGAMIRFMNSLIDVVGDDEGHELASLLDFVGNLVRDYETRHVRLDRAAATGKNSRRKSR